MYSMFNVFVIFILCIILFIVSILFFQVTKYFCETQQIARSILGQINAEETTDDDDDDDDRIIDDEEETDTDGEKTENEKKDL